MLPPVGDLSLVVHSVRQSLNVAIAKLEQVDGAVNALLAGQLDFAAQDLKIRQ
jgi:hypothetical protein